jgi:hypothetical protein
MSGMEKKFFFFSMEKNLSMVIKEKKKKNLLIDLRMSGKQEKKKISIEKFFSIEKKIYPYKKKFLTHMP